MRQASTTPEAPVPAPTRRPLWAGGGGTTNLMATTSLVLGLVWLGGLGSVAAVLCGHRAQRQIAEHWQPGADRARTGIRLGWLGIVITAVLAVLVVATPEQLAHQLDQVERVVRDFFDGRGPFS